MEISIRQAEARDFPQIARIMSDDEAWTCYGIDFDEAMKLVRTAEDTFYLAELEGQVIGFFAIRLNGVGNFGAYLRMIAVGKPYRYKGVGKAMLDYAFALTVKHIPNLFLICSEDNKNAQRFYEYMGFKKVGVMDDLVVAGHGEILYRKTAGPLRTGRGR